MNPPLTRRGRDYNFWRVIALVGIFCSSQTAGAEDSLAAILADGKPWEMYVVKRRKSNIMVFHPDGRATISSGFESIHPTWTVVPDGICIKPEGFAERCLELSRTPDGIVASQKGKTIFILKR